MYAMYAEWVLCITPSGLPLHQPSLFYITMLYKYHSCLYGLFCRSYIWCIIEWTKLKYNSSLYEGLNSDLMPFFIKACMSSISLEFDNAGRTNKRHLRSFQTIIHTQRKWHIRSPILILERSSNQYIFFLFFLKTVERRKICVGQVAQWTQIRDVFLPICLLQFNRQNVSFIVVQETVCTITVR